MNETAEDFKRKYKGTYVFIEMDGKNHLVQFIDTWLTDTEENFKFKSKHFGELILNKEDTFKKVSLKFPKQGMYNVRGSASLFFRIPNRQWKRAPCSENCGLQNVLEYIDNSRNPINLDTISQIFSNKYPKSLEAAAEDCVGSIALNLDFAISLSNKKKYDFLFWYKTNPIGFISYNEQKILIHNNNLYQEVVDFCKYKENSWNPILANP